MSAPPLLERIRTGLPPALHVAEIAELERPDDPVARDTLARHIGRAVDLGDLPATEGSEIGQGVARSGMSTSAPIRPIQPPPDPAPTGQPFSPGLAD